MIKEEFGDNSLKIVKSDPFQLCKIKGFGFMTVDSIARKTKVSLKHPMRYSGAINYVLDEARVSGHLFLTVDETVGQCYDLLNSDCEEEVVSEEEIRQAISMSVCAKSKLPSGLCPCSSRKGSMRSVTWMKRSIGRRKTCIRDWPLLSAML